VSYFSLQGIDIQNSFDFVYQGSIMIAQNIKFGYYLATLHTVQPGGLVCVPLLLQDMYVIQKFSCSFKLSVI
jgi:hypothetical protein